MKYDDLLPLIPYVTPNQALLIQALSDTGSHRKAAKKLGIDHRNIHRTIKNAKKHAASKGYSPDHDYTHSVPEPFVAGGVSTYYDKDGKPTQQWVKSRLDKQQFDEMLQEQADLFFETLPKLKSPKFNMKNYQKEIIPWFQIGDAHLGMLAHEAETGGNFDLKIAVAELMSAFQILFDECVPGERCVINDLGDFTHYENFSGTTEASGHVLDYDGRFPKMIDYYIPLMRFILESALTKFRHVDVIVNQGNHSRTNDIWMARLLNAVYEGDDRIHVLKNSNVFIPYRMDDTFVMTHRSDKCKPDRLAKVMATDYAEDWGEARFRYIDVGHVHHGFTSKEHPGVLIESWNNLANKDLYAHNGGWRSRQSITRVDRSRKYGNVGRRTLSVEEVRDQIQKGLIKAVNGYKYQPETKVYKV